MFGLKTTFFKRKPEAKEPANKSVVMSDGLPVFDSELRRTIWENYFTNLYSYSNTAQWQSLQGLQSLIGWFHTNPVLHAVVTILGRESSNMKYEVFNRDNEEVEIDGKTKVAEVQKIYNLLNRPNCTQYRAEFIHQKKIFEKVLGVNMTYANSPIGFNSRNPRIDAVQALWNVWPQYMNYKLTGRYFDALEMADIIQSWKYEFNTYKKDFNPYEILFSNAVNTDPKDGLIFGKPIAQSLIKPLTNIDMAYESRNVMMRNRGMRVVLSSAKADESGPIPLLASEKKAVDDAQKQYGMLEGQKQFAFFDQPLTVTVIDQDVRKLGLLEEVATDAQIVSLDFGVPPDITRLFMQGITYENQEASYRRLYQGTIIPDAENDVITVNDWFGLRETKWQIRGTFNHVAVLQKSEKDKADANSKTSSYYKDLFLAGAVTINQWLTAVGEKTFPEGEIRVFDMDDRQISILLNKFTLQSDNNGQQNGQNQGQNSGQESGQTNGQKINGKELNGHRTVIMN